MTDCLYADVSEHQPAHADDSYPYHFIAIRSNDGTYLDKKFQANLAWCKKAVANKQITGFAVYFVFEPNWRETLATFQQAVGTPHPSMAVMLDVETWGGKMTGDHSAAINACREGVIAWLRPHMTLAQRLRRLPRKRVIGYGNAGDLAAMWPKRGDIRIVLANYSSNPAYPGKIAHQFSSHFYVPPFGYVDINSADGLSPAQFAAALGLPSNAVAKPVPHPPVDPPKPPLPPVPPAPHPPVPPPPIVTPPLATPGDAGLDRILTELRAYIAGHYTKG